MSVGVLTPEQLDALLREPIVARLATTTDEGYPYIVPVWTEWDGEAAWLVIRAKAEFARHLVARPKVALSIVRPDDPDTRALILGRAEVLEGPGPLEGRTLDIAERMGRRYEGEAGQAYVEESRDWPRLLVRIVPEQIVSWTGGDWHLRYR